MAVEAVEEAVEAVEEAVEAVEEAVEVVEEVEDHHNNNNNHNNSRMFRPHQASEQWENSQKYLMEIEPRQKTLLKKSKDTFVLTKT